MTHAQRNAEILRLLEEQTKRAVVSKKAARDSLVREGIYTTKGKLRVEFRERDEKAAATA